MFIKLGALLLPLLIAGIYSTSVMAVESDIRTSRSISYSNSDDIDQASKDALLLQTEIDTMASLQTQGYRLESTASAVQVIISDYGSEGEYTVYDASTSLISDFDYDGFYHRFSVSVDVDTIYDTARVYAELYLSYEGGPWNLYAISDNYVIHGDSEFDRFTIETELADGFPTGYYDLRIEVFDSDSDHWLTAYGPYDDASLSALPLEDSYYDEDSAYYPVETTVVVAGHGHGAMGAWWLMVPVLLRVFRRLTGTV